MRSRIVTSGLTAAAAVVVLGLSVPAFAVDESLSGTGSLEETVVTTTEDEDTTDTVDQTLDDVDDAVASTEDEIDETAAEGPEPVAETVDDTTDTTTDTTDAVTDTLQDSADDPTDPEGSPTDDQKGAGDDTTPAPAPDAPTSVAPDGRSLAGGTTSTPPTRMALDGFRRTSGGTSELAVTADPVFEPEPAFAPPTTRHVVEPTATAAPRLSLRAVAIEILVATALLVLATGGLVAELGPERA